MRRESKGRIGFVTLGCAKNRVDSEVMLGMLASKGFEVGPADETCDAVIVNTCAFVEDAKVEAVEEILESLELREVNPELKVYVAGCLPQRYPIEVGKDIENLAGVYGVDEIEKLVADVVSQLTKVEEIEIDGPRLKVDTDVAPHWLYDHDTPRLLTTPSHYAYVKISEGCDHKCSFCTIPSIRGPYRSREVLSVVAEVNNLVRRGVKEINLVSQDTTAFGVDTGTSLKRLLTELDKIPEDIWIRMLYLHPEKLDEDLLGIVRDSEKILNYFDIPLQHVDGKILESMRRTSPTRDYLEMVKWIRGFFGEDEVALRTTLITGYPGEGEEEFEKLADFVLQAQFDRLSVFKFSRENGTEAFDMEPRVESYEMEHRFHALMNIQADVSFARNERYIGRKLRVLVEGTDEETEKLFGRSFRDAPEVDGIVYINGEADEGEFIDVKIVEAEEYDLHGEVI